MKKRPNILFIMTDEQRYDAVGYENPQVITPHLDALAAQAVRFTRAYTTNPSCIPARAALFTGRYPSQCGAPTYITPLPAHETTFMRLLQQGGYHTAVVGKQHFWTSQVEKGYDYMDIVDDHFPPQRISKELEPGAFGPPQNRTVMGGVSSYVEFLADSGFTRGDQLYRQVSDKGIYEFFGGEEYHVDCYVGDRGLEWLREKRPKRKPWFLTLSFPGPHMPFDGLGLPEAELYREEELEAPHTELRDIFEKPPHYLDIVKKFGGVDRAHKTSPGGFTAAELRRLKLAYYANMTLIDRKIGQVVGFLKQQGLYDDTLIVFTSDHGDYLGEFGVATKAQYCSEALMRIPLLLKPPVAGFEGREERSFVSSVELAATFLAAAGLPAPPNISQRSLTAFYSQPAPERWKDIYFEAQDIRALREERYKLIYYANRPYGELYDLELDPYEKHNLWDLPELQSEKQRLIRRLLDKVIALGENAAVPWNLGAPVI